MLEIAVLGLLKEQPLHGYELKKRLSETLGFLWGVSYGSLYPALRRLEREGAIEVVAEPIAAPDRATSSLRGDLAAASGVPVGRRSSPPCAQAYRITPAGVARFEELLLADDPHADEDKAFALKLAFCSELPAPARIELLERRHVVLLTRLNQSRRATATRNDRYSRSIVEHRVRSIQRDLEWVEELLEAERATEVTDQPEPPGLPEVTEGVSR
jgi:DNA-binding PadR family transcriptional regulator